MRIQHYIICETLLRRELLLLRRRREGVMDRHMRRSYNRFLRTTLKRLRGVREDVERNVCPICGKRFRKHHGLVVHLTSGRRNKCKHALSLIIKYEVSRYFSERG